MIKNLFMDADDTLFDFRAGQRIAFFGTMQKLNITVSEENYLLYDGINDKYWKIFEKGGISKERLVYARFEEFYKTVGIDADAYKTEEIYQSLLGEQAVWYNGAQDGIKKLADKYAIYILTNGHGDTQKHRVHISGLDKYIKNLFISECVGFPKPRIEYYQYCFNESSVIKEETLAIGDSLSSDIKGGINAGLKTVWCNFSHLPSDEKITPDFTVYNWDELLKLLL